MGKTLVGSGDSRVIEFGKMYVVFPDMVFYGIVKKALSCWYGVDIDYLPEALKLMNLKETRYTAEKQAVRETEISISLSSAQTKYVLRLHRGGDKFNPYPCWTLKANDEKFGICFIVKMKVDVQFNCVVTSSGSVVD